MSMSATSTITAFGKQYDVSISFDHYHNGRLAVRANTAEGTFGMVSVNIPAADIGPDEFAVKNYNENQGWAEDLLEQMSDQFENTGRTAQSGFVTCPIYRIKAPPIP